MPSKDLIQFDRPVFSMPYLQSGSTEIEHAQGMRLGKTKG